MYKAIDDRVYRVETRDLGHRNEVIVQCDHSERTVHVVPYDHQSTARQLSTDDFIQMHNEYMRDDPNYRHPGPTNQQLQDCLALAQAWREYQIIARLIEK